DYLALAPTAAEIKRHCPALADEVDKKMGGLERDVRAGFAQCRELLDWSSARRIGMQSGGDGKAANDCSGVVLLEDITAEYEVGSERYRLLIHHATRLPDRLVIADGPQCSRAGAAAIAPRSPGSDAGARPSSGR